MTALAGLWRFDGGPGAAAACDRMLGAQRIYGPHGTKTWDGGEVALGRALYRTLPEDRHDAQPVVGGGGRYRLVADLRLDNRSELEHALGLSGETARTMADAALLMRCWERWGEAALDRIVGEFAFALWDGEAKALLLARDFAGQRPLHHHRGRGFFAFATMPKGLHAHPDVPYGPDEQAVAEFVALLPADPGRSFFKDIAPVPAAHLMTVSRDAVSLRRYWKPSRPRSWRGGRPGDYAEGLRHHLDQAVRARLRGAGGAVAAHLSAGYDSAAVTATAAGLLAPEGGRVVAFTAVPREGYDGPCPRNRIGDEGPLAAATAAMYPNIEHVLVRTGDRSPLAEADRGFFLFDRPMLNLCNHVWMTGISAAARDRGLGVLLTGQMGNMSLSYSGLEFLPELVRSGRLVRAFGEGAKLVVKRGASWRMVLAHSLAPFVPASVWRAINRLYGRTMDVLDYTAIRKDRLIELDLPRLARERQLDLSYRPRIGAFETRLWVIARGDLANYHKGTLAGWGVDQRDPTLDRRLFEYCLAAPMGAFVSGGRLRALAHEALADRLPREVLQERRKGYQAVDWHEGLTAAHGEIGAELQRLASDAAAASTLDCARLARLIEEVPETDWNRQDVIASYRLALYRGLSAGHFLRRASGTNA